MSAGVGNSVGKSYAPQRVPKTDVQKPNSNNNTTSSGSASTGNANASSNAATRDTRADDQVDISRDASSRQQAAPTQEQQRLTHLRALEENYAVFDDTEGNETDGITGLGDIERIADGDLDEDQVRDKLRQQGVEEDQLDDRLDSIRNTASFLLEDEEFRESIDTANDNNGEGDPDGKLGRGDLDKSLLNAEAEERERKLEAQQQAGAQPPSEEEVRASKDAFNRWSDPGALEQDLKERPLSEFSGAELDALVAMNESNPEAQQKIEQAVLDSVNSSDALDGLPKSESYSYLLDRYVTGREIPEDQADRENDPTVKAQEHLDGMVKSAVDGSLDRHLEGRSGDEDLALAQERVSGDLEGMVMDNPALAKIFESQTEASFNDYSDKFTDVARSDDNLFQRINHTVTGGIQDAVGGITEKYRDVVEQFTEKTSGIAKQGFSLIDDGWDLAGKIGEKGFDLVGAEGVGDNFRNATDQIGDTVEGAGSFAADQYKNFYRGVHESIAGAAEGIAFAVTDPVATAKGLVETIKDPSLLIEGYKETLNEHGVAGLAGQITGDLGSAVLTGGAGAAAKGTSIAGRIGRLSNGRRGPSVEPSNISQRISGQADTPDAASPRSDVAEADGSAPRVDNPDGESPTSRGPDSGNAGTITSNMLDFNNGADVVSGAQKFILPVPKFKDGGEPLVYPKGATDANGGSLAGRPITDWEGKPIGDRGVVFYNHKDQSWQAAPADGNGVVIMNQVDEAQGRALQDLVGDNPNDLTIDQFKEVLEKAGRSGDEGGLGLGDMYNSDRDFIQSKMNKLETADTGVDDYGLHRRDDRDVSQAVYVDGAGEFQGPAATPQKLEDGAVIIRQPDAKADDGFSYRLVQPETFKETYRNKDGSPIDLAGLPAGSARTASQIENRLANIPQAVQTLNQVDAAPPKPGRRQLGEDELAVQSRADQLVDEDLNGVLQRYQEKYGTNFDLDDAREMFADYNQSPETRSRYGSAVHNPSGRIIDELFERKLAEPVLPGTNPRAVFTAGGSGSGKSSARGLSRAMDDADFVFDSTMANHEFSREAIQRTLDSGRDVNVSYVYRDPVDAFINGVIPRAAESGRIVPIEVFTNIHQKVGPSVRKIADEFGDDPRFSMDVVDNSRGKDNAALTTLDQLPQPSFDNLTETLYSSLHEAYNRGDVPQHVYDAFLREKP